MASRFSDLTNSYDMGGNGLVEGPQDWTQQPMGPTLPDIPGIGDQHGGQFWPGYAGPEYWDSGTGMGIPNPNYVPPPAGWYDTPKVATPTTPAPTASPWQNPANAFAPGASQNAPRLFQDPTSGLWTLSEHGNFRNDPDLQANIAAHQQRVTDYWNQFPTGFIQPGQTNFDPRQALTNEQYGTPSNWQSLWTNAGLQPGTQNPLQPTATLTPGTGTGGAGTLAELSNPERVNQLSQSSYGDFTI